jgi:hypothetical protein
MLRQMSSTKLTGARVKYQSKSQHGRLAMAPHLDVKVVARAARFFEGLLKIGEVIGS